MSDDKKPTPPDEKTRFVEAVLEGLADADAGRVHSDAEVAKRMAARFRAKLTRARCS